MHMFTAKLFLSEQLFPFPIQNPAKFIFNAKNAPDRSIYELITLNLFTVLLLVWLLLGLVLMNGSQVVFSMNEFLVSCSLSHGEFGNRAW